MAGLSCFILLKKISVCWWIFFSQSVCVDPIRIYLVIMFVCVCLCIGPNTQIQSILFREFESALCFAGWVVIHKTSCMNVVVVMDHLLRVQWTVRLAVVLVLAT